MKERCQCGKPDIPIIDSLTLVRLGTVDRLLHFKTADRYCERCGAALCEDCGTNGYWSYCRISGIGTYVFGTYCPTCKEER